MSHGIVKKPSSLTECIGVPGFFLATRLFGNCGVAFNLMGKKISPILRNLLDGPVVNNELILGQLGGQPGLLRNKNVAEVKLGPTYRLLDAEVS